MPEERPPPRGDRSDPSSQGVHPRESEESSSPRGYQAAASSAVAYVGAVACDTAGALLRDRAPGTDGTHERAGGPLAAQRPAPTLAAYERQQCADPWLDETVTPRYETILLATDGSHASQPASEQAIDLATQVGARLLVVSVVASARRLSPL